MKKNDKIKILLFIFLMTLLITWFFAGGTYDANGTFSLSKITRGGIFDAILAFMYSIYYKIDEFFYLLTIGGCYGILSQTKSYRKLVDKTVDLVKGKEIPFFLLTTFITSLVISISAEILTVFMFAPFVVTVFLKCGKDRLTALSAGIGGIFIGICGLTFGTFGVENMNNAIGLSYTQGIGFKIAFFVLSYVLYNLFAILHMNKQYKDVDETKYDMFTTEPLEEKGKKKKTKLWPTILMIILLIITIIIAYINWEASFGVKVFTTIEEKFEQISIRGIPVLYSIAGSTSAFGNWKDLLGASAILIITTLMIGIFNKVSLDTMIDNFLDGIKKIFRVALTFVILYAIFVLVSWYGWPITLIDVIIGNGKFNIARLLFGAIIAGFYLIENNYTGYVFGEFIKNSFAKNALATVLLFNTTSGIVASISPTSITLMLGLSAYEIPYKSWLGYIWKYALSMIVVVAIVISIMVYM